MEMRMFGRTGMQFSVLGFGCGAVGGLIVRGDPADQERTIARAIAAGEHADADDADAGRHSMIEEPSIILCWIILRQCSGRGRVEHIVDHLSAVECARVDHLMQRPRVADCGKPKETRLALLAQVARCVSRPLDAGLIASLRHHGSHVSPVVTL